MMRHIFKIAFNSCKASKKKKCIVYLWSVVSSIDGKYQTISATCHLRLICPLMLEKKKGEIKFTGRPNTVESTIC